MMKRIWSLCAACCLLAAISIPASALEYTVDAPEDHLFGRPTSVDTIYVTTEEPANTDRSKSAARIPPVFGSPTSYTLNAGELLTPNLVAPGTSSGGITGGGGITVVPPGTSGGGSWTGGTIAFTEVTDDLYYSGGYLGTLKIPAIDLSVKVYQGTDSAALRKGAGHFRNTSIWDGNVCVAGHNRGVRDDFGDLHTLEYGDTITWTTKLGTRIYEVVSVEKVRETDTSGTTATSDNRMTLYTCVRNQRDYRWMVQAEER